jgi:peptidyl-tRNA hydrolase, PTH1 family
LWLIVGLGNPGSRYARTRHNIGFQVLDEFARRLRLEWKDRTEYKMCSGSIGDERIVLLEPLTFMNRSGNAVRKVSDKFAVGPENTIVVHDDLDLETGRLKIRKNGSSGGHKGVDSIIQHLGSKNFIRVKIGIGRDQFIPTEEYVLKKFRPDESALIGEAVQSAVESIETIITDGVEKAMNRFNRGPVA